MTAPIYRGKRAVVIGYGITGRAVVEFLAEKGAVVSVYDDAKGRSLPESPEGMASSFDDQFRSVVESADLVVVSPGVPRSHPVFQFAQSPISELELAYRHSETPMVAVTGTNGKTTVTTLITEMLVRAGLRARAVGNIGTSIVSMLGEKLDYFVVEASSFQLATTESFRPKVAVWTNFTPDHLDWHQGIDHYLASKAKIFENQQPGDAAVINGGDLVVCGIELRPGVRRFSFGLGAFDFGLDAQRSALTKGGEPFLLLSEMIRTLPHDLENALASAAAAFSAGAGLAEIAAVLKEFGGLPHRVEFLGMLDGVSFYNDSKATTPASVIAGVRGFESVVLIAGGKNKGLDLSPLVTLAPKLRAVVAIGQSSDELAALFAEGSSVPVVKASSMTEAVKNARQLAVKGDVVLLSPGCTSYDWYGSYEQRGDDFKAVLETMRSVRGGL